MSAKDIIHEPVVKALTNDGWTITDDPLVLRIGRRVAKADLGAERLIGATRDNERIAVEIKSFLQSSVMTEFEKALGQYMLYEDFLDEIDAERKVYMAVSQSTYTTLFQEAAFQKSLKRRNIRLIVVDLNVKKVVKWID